jgi:fumarate hydratase class II
MSGMPMPARFIQSLGLVKAAAARANREPGVLDGDRADAIYCAALKVAAGEYLDQFPIDVFQTGSGTRTNMNANEVIASLAPQQLSTLVNPNDQINRIQSSNDVIPTTIHVSASLAVHEQHIPGIKQLPGVIHTREKELQN